MSLLRPGIEIGKITEVDLGTLWERGKRGLLIDADNTLLPYGEASLPQGYREWLDSAASMGFRIVVFTNNFKPRAEKIKKALSLPVVYGWVKPWPWGMRRALRVLGLPRGQVILVGDQLFTDILGANLSGIDSALVSPISPKDGAWTRLMRKLEKLSGRGGK